MIPPPPRSTLFPYTTLFRSSSMLTARRWKMLQTIARQCFAGGEPDAGQGLHTGDEPVQHRRPEGAPGNEGDRKSTRLNSSHPSISYAVFCLKKKKTRSRI